MTPLDTIHLAGPGASTAVCGVEHRPHLVITASPGEITCSECVRLWEQRVKAVPK